MAEATNVDRYFSACDEEINCLADKSSGANTKEHWCMGESISKLGKSHEIQRTTSGIRTRRTEQSFMQVLR